MKKYFLILVLACSLTVQTGAQDAAAMQRMQELNKQMQSISQQIRKAFDKKDYVLVAELNYQGISMVDSNHDFLRSVTGVIGKSRPSRDIFIMTWRVPIHAGG